jgi:cellulose synthase/poly-beta-1,6-N-acetylglucosamine synthase-like glycosyltransferase
VKIIFWMSLVGVLYTYAGYPVAMWMLARLRPRPWKAAPINPSVSIVLAVHNGVSLLPRKIQHLLDLDYPNIREIIIVSDGSTDDTAELLVRQKHSLIKTIVLREHGGKAAAINAGVAEATAEIILFVDIRPEVATGAIQHLVGNFADPKVACVAGELILREAGHDAASAAVGGLYWRYEQWIRKCEAVFDSPVGVYGGFYAIRRKLFVQQPAGLILDDMFQPLSIIRQGYRSVLDPLACVYDTWPENVEGEFHRKVRTLAGNFQLIQLAPWTLTPRNRVLFQLVSHKVMRLIVPYLLALLLVSTVVLSATYALCAAFAALQILGWIVAIAGLRYRIPVLHRIAAPASALLVLNAAAVVGLYKFLFARGPLWKIWNSGRPEALRSTPETENLASPDAIACGAETEIGKRSFTDSQQRREHRPAMIYKKNTLFISVLGIGAIVTGLAIHYHIVNVKAAKLEHVVPPAPYFPPGAIWTQDVSHAPVDPNSSEIIAWLADAGGWGNNNRMQIDFSLRVLQADAATPFVPFRKGEQFYSQDSDLVTAFPLPAGGGIEGQPGYQCDTDQNDCHLIVVDRSHGKLYEAYQANYADGALTANGVVVWNLNRIYPASGRGDQCSSTDAAGFPIAPLLFNADELATGSINHAIRFILPNPRIRAHVFVHPATHAGAPRGPVTAPPMGARFRLKASFDMSKLTPAAQVVARAMQKYGMFLSDGGNIALTAQNDTDTKAKYTDMDFGSHDLQDIKVTDFEVLDLGKPIRLTDDCELSRER